MQAIFWGVRGSYPVPGPDTVRYGGNTSCVELLAHSGERVIVDAGTGLARLGEALASQGVRGGDYHVLLSHLHWDHIQGLPFFAPAYDGDARLALHALHDDMQTLEQIVRGVTRHDFFPTPIDALPARVSYQPVQPGRGFGALSFAVTPFRLNHPFGAVGYRIEADGVRCAYVCDTAPFDLLLHKQHFLRGPEPLDEADRRALQALRAGVVEAIRGCDLVIYDTHYTPEEYQRFPHFGHSTPDHAIDLCTGLGVGTLALFHHAPNRTDDELDRLATYYRHRGELSGIEVVTAREGMALQVSRSRGGR